MSKFIDLAGKRFGNWTVIGLDGKDKCGNLMRKYLCDCGSHRVVQGSNLKSGIFKSCVCLTGIPHLRHECASYSQLYRTWHNMRQRCFNRNDKRYEDYGGRGIAVCNEWANNFQAFQEWALLHGYQDNLTIDKINNNGNYEPDNCRWVSMKEQGKSSTRVGMKAIGVEPFLI